jgi:hypothetical protein
MLVRKLFPCRKVKVSPPDQSMPKPEAGDRYFYTLRNVM